MPCEGEGEYDFAFTLPIDDALLIRKDVSVSELKVFGRAFFKQGELNVAGSVSYRVSGKCDRCIKPAAAEICSVFDEVFAHSGDYTFDERSVYLEPLVRDAVLNSFPNKLLCSEECKGICPQCGRDRNLGCECVSFDNKSTNPFSILNDLGGQNGSSKKKNL